MFQARRPPHPFRIERNTKGCGFHEGVAEPKGNIMTAISPSVLRALEPVTLDLYRDIHKGIRAELFAVTGAAGSLDPADRAGRADLARHVQSVVEMLVGHAEHEDAVVQPVLETYLPALAEQIAIDHPMLEARIAEIGDLAGRVVDAPEAAARADVHRIYLELASFTSAYLAHQETEERDVMPALEAAVGVDRVVVLHRAIVGSIPPDEMAKGLSVMLPAMNVDDRTELLGGMQAGAPSAVFAGVWSLAKSVLAPADVSALARRLGIS